MVITKTPFRVSFFGGGSDYPDYYLKYSGEVIGTTIDKYAYLTVRKLPPFFNYNYRVGYSIIEETKSINEIKHPAVKNILKALRVNYPVSITYDGDLPARSGLGSSSSFSVGLIKAIYALNRKLIDKKELAHKAIYIEQKVIKENVGSQDQIFASYGGLNRIKFLTNGEILVEPLFLNERKLKMLENNLMLFYSGISRFASKIAKNQIDKIKINKVKIDKIKSLVKIAYEILNKGKLDEFGELLDYSWKIKRSLDDNISNEKIDEIYNKARKAGAIGGKLLGAGGGGFLLFYVRKKDQKNVLETLKNYIYVPFKFEFNGSEIIFYKNNF